MYLPTFIANKWLIWFDLNLYLFDIAANTPNKMFTKLHMDYVILTHLINSFTFRTAIILMMILGVDSCKYLVEPNNLYAVRLKLLELVALGIVCIIAPKFIDGFSALLRNFIGELSLLT